MLKEICKNKNERIRKFPEVGEVYQGEINQAKVEIIKVDKKSGWITIKVLGQDKKIIKGHINLWEHLQLTRI